MYPLQEKPTKNVFSPQDLVLWHHPGGKQLIPIAGVVVRQEGDGIIIRVHVGGMSQEREVDPDELVNR